MASIAASQWGLSADRVAIIADGSDEPDTYQSGLDNGYNQQWSHAYIYDRWFSKSFYLWGDADDDFKDNLDGPLGGEGYDGKYAGYWYANGDRASGDKWLGIALHFIEDVSLTLHSTAPTSSGITVPMKTTDMLTKLRAIRPAQVPATRPWWRIRKRCSSLREDMRRERSNTLSIVTPPGSSARIFHQIRRRSVARPPHIQKYAPGGGLCRSLSLMKSPSPRSRRIYPEARIFH